MRDTGIEGLADQRINEDGSILVGFLMVLPENWNTAKRPASTSMTRQARPNSPPVTMLRPVGEGGAERRLRRSYRNLGTPLD